MSVSSLLEYYSEILPDPQGMLSLSQDPLAACLWTNTLKVTPERLQALLHADGIQVQSLAWNPGAFKVLAGQIGKCWQYQAGLFQIQEEVSMLPGVLLGAEPSEKILDLCAAPGNKTAQLAVAMQNTGTLIANDRSAGRMRALGQMMRRLSVLNISTVLYDGCFFPQCDNYFDRVLVDAPCSCEGTYRKNVTKQIEPSQRRSLKMARLQRMLLKKALQLVRPGGRVIYSTCTFAPEENEAVVSAVLHELGELVRVVPIKLHAFNYSPGVTFWKNEQYHPDVVRTMRVWPHQNDTGGFYVALLEKITGASTSVSVKSLVGNTARVQPYHALLQARFGLSQACWHDYQIITESRRGFYLTNKEHAVPHMLRTDATGMFYLKTRTNYPKLTTAAASLFGKFVQRNKIFLLREEVEAYVAQQEIQLTPARVVEMTETGFVFVFFEELILGIGLYLSAYQDQPPRLRSLFPAYLPAQSAKGEHR